MATFPSMNSEKVQRYLADYSGQKLIQTTLKKFKLNSFAVWKVVEADPVIKSEEAPNTESFWNYYQQS